MAQGCHPDKDHTGQKYADMESLTPSQKVRLELAGKPLIQRSNSRTVVIMAITGDVEYFCQEFSFPYAMSNVPCPFCKADNLHAGSTAPFTDFREHAT